MNGSSSLSVTETVDDQSAAEVFARQRSRLRAFIRKRVRDLADVEDIVQDVFYELVEAERAVQPIEQVVAWLFRVARNRVTDRFRKSAREPSLAGITDEALLAAERESSVADLLPSSDEPEALYARELLLEELDAALDELPAEQREVFVQHELEGYSFKELAARSGININTLLARKRYAVLYLRQRLRAIYREFVEP